MDHRQADPPSTEEAIRLWHVAQGQLFAVVYGLRNRPVEKAAHGTHMAGDAMRDKLLVAEARVVELTATLAGAPREQLEVLFANRVRTEEEERFKTWKRNTR